MVMPMGFHAIKVTQWHKLATTKPGDQIFISTFAKFIRLLADFPDYQACYLDALNKIIMKRKFLSVSVAFAVLLTSCAVHVTDSKVPPGQAKKTSAPGQVKKQTGSQSAQPYAPGQKKKS
jgi:hypothetical protein